MNVKQWKHLKMEILQLCRIDPFLLLFTVTVFANVCVVGRMLLFRFLSSQSCGISSAAKKSSLIFQFSLFHWYFLNMGFIYMAVQQY